MKLQINRKLKSLDNKTGSKIKIIVNNIILDHEKYKKCYFWSPPGSASSRRAIEFDKKLSFLLNDKKYEIHQYLECSCKNMYFKTNIYVNDNKKTISALKNIC